MRQAALCLGLLLVPVACGDAVGSNYTPGTSGAALEAEVPETPAERAAALGATREIDYTCAGSATTAHVTLYGSEEMASVLIAGLMDAPAYLDCSSTRIGPECSDGTFHALINTVAGTAEFFRSAADDTVACEAAQPG